jgi:hypothetical protein
MFFINCPPPRFDHLSFRLGQGCHAGYHRLPLRTIIGALSMAGQRAADAVTQICTTDRLEQKLCGTLARAGPPT